MSMLTGGYCEICGEGPLPTPQNKMCEPCRKLVYEETKKLTREARAQAKINVRRKLRVQSWRTRLRREMASHDSAFR